MIATRLIGVVLVKNGWVVQSVKFERYFPVGKPGIAIEYLDRWGIDEIVLLDIDKQLKMQDRNYERIRRYFRNIRTPVAIGGGITNVVDAQLLIRYGADKVVINTAFLENPTVIQDLSSVLGSQAVVVSLDAKVTAENEYRPVNHLRRIASDLTIVEAVKLAQENGAGEIFINSIEADGSKTGYDLRLAKQVLQATNLPVVICGGVGWPRHFLDGIRLGVSGIAAANYFHFSEHSVIKVKKYLSVLDEENIIRLNTDSTYDNASFDEFGTMLPREEQELDEIRYDSYSEEII